VKPLGSHSTVRVMSDWSRYTEQNRRGWNEIADVRSREYGEAMHDASFFHEGGSILDPRVQELAGDVKGLSLLHLMCASGEETLSWAVQGAEVVGVDISDRQVEIAKAKAQAAGVGARFIRADIGALPRELQRQTFDIVYTATGVLAWLPDLTIWAAGVAAALRPEGRFLLWEIHPISLCFEADETSIRLAEDYFATGKPDAYTDWTHFPGGEGARETKYNFSWTLGDIVSSLGAAGLPTDSLHEYPGEGESQYVPGRVLLQAARRNFGAKASS
jgi:2-polyprenyl-3-methyl-5-hydroxy-6-metoxy-1,4-benzoquinol methylase